MNELKISVVMPVYNAELYLKEAIDSILEQSYKDFELVIVNDGSTDRSEEIIQKYNDDRIVYLYKPNGGIASALNLGIEKAQGEFIARMDSDDIAMHSRLEKQLNFMISHPDYIAVGSNATVITREGNDIYNTNVFLTDIELKEQLPKTPFIHPTVMYRKYVDNNLIKYPIYMHNFAEDQVLFNRLSEYGKYANLKDSLLRYRLVPMANTNHGSKSSLSLNLVIKKAIEFDSISENDIDCIKKEKGVSNTITRESNYFVLVAKKYLWNVGNHRMARVNLIESMKLSVELEKLILYTISFLPSSLVKKLYGMVRK